MILFGPKFHSNTAALQSVRLWSGHHKTEATTRTQRSQPGSCFGSCTSRGRVKMGKTLRYLLGYQCWLAPAQILDSTMTKPTIPFLSGPRMGQWSIINKQVTMPCSSWRPADGGLDSAVFSRGGNG